MQKKSADSHLIAQWPFEECIEWPLANHHVEPHIPQCQHNFLILVIKRHKLYTLQRTSQSEYHTATVSNYNYGSYFDQKF